LRIVFSHPIGGWVATTKHRLGQFAPDFLEDQESTESPVQREILLDHHSLGVAQHARQFAEGCGLDAGLYQEVGLWHDLGKLDARFQAMLRQSSPRTVAGEPLAKSARSPRTKEERDRAREIDRYPAGGRHELLSAALVSTKSDDDCLLHLIATHHGSARPFADPVVENADSRKPFNVALFDQAFTLDTSEQRIAAWNAELPERFWRVVRKFGWWGTAYREAVFRLADQAQSREEQERVWQPPERNKLSLASPTKVQRPAFYPLPLHGLDGANPLAFLAALGTLVACDHLSRSDIGPEWLHGSVALSWGSGYSPQTPVLHLPTVVPSATEFVKYLGEHLPRTPESHPCARVVKVLSNGNNDVAQSIRELCGAPQEKDRPCLDWMTALILETAPEAASQLQTVRRDYLLDNIRQVMYLTKDNHLERSLFQTWDYADGLANQSLHWEPTEDRRHAYQWHMPSGDPTRKKRGGMLGANRLALEAWPLFPSFPAANRSATRGFKGNRAYNTYFTWPLWTCPLTVDAVTSLLALEALQIEEPSHRDLRHYNVPFAFRAQRILVGKTPNFTTARSIG
jgi:CRISPR-associated endonuclease/helicase Cas3